MGVTGTGATRQGVTDNGVTGTGTTRASVTRTTVLVRRLATRCVIGTRDWERTTQQDVVLDIAIGVDAAAGATDDFGQAVDYVAMRDRVLAHVSASRFQLLEALALSVADLVLEHPRALDVEVTVDKPGALTGAEVGVRVTARR